MEKASPSNLVPMVCFRLNGVHHKRYIELLTPKSPDVTLLRNGVIVEVIIKMMSYQGRVGL